MIEIGEGIERVSSREGLAIEIQQILDTLGNSCPGDRGGLILDILHRDTAHCRALVVAHLHIVHEPVPQDGFGAVAEGVYGKINGILDTCLYHIRCI